MNFDIKKVKIIVTVPIENVEEVRNAICNEGAGVIGNYTYCTMSTKCIGTFIPDDKDGVVEIHKEDMNLNYYLGIIQLYLSSFTYRYTLNNHIFNEYTLNKNRRHFNFFKIFSCFLHSFFIKIMFHLCTI